MITPSQNRITSLGFSSGVTAIALLLILCAAVKSVRDLQRASWYLLLAFSVLLIARLLFVAQRWTRHNDIFSPVIAFPVAFLAWFTIGSIDWVELPTIFNFGLFDPIPGSMWWLYALGLGGFLLGALLLRAPIRQWEARHTSDSWADRRAFAALLGLGVIVITSWTALAVQFGVPGLSSAPSDVRLRLHGPFYVSFVVSSWLLIMMAPLVSWGRSAAKSERLVVASAAVLSLLLLASMAGRSNIFIPLLTMLIVSHVANSRLHLRGIAFILITLFISMSVMGYLRDFAQSEDALDWLKLTGAPEPVLPLAYAGIYIRYSVATFRDVTQMIPAHVPYQHGALTFAPLKTLLPEHQDMSDVYFKKLLGNDFQGAGQPATLLGPLYADFGPLGIFVGMAGYGILLQFLYRRMRRQPTPLRILLYAWVLQSGLFGLFATLFPYITTLLIPLSCWALDKLIRRSQYEVPAT